MKKLLITLLVLCMASAAQAQLSLIADEELPIAYITGLLDHDLYIILDSWEGITVELGPDAGPGSGPIAPPLIPVDSPLLPPWEDIWILTIQTSPVAGTYLIAHGVVGDTVVAGWFDENMNSEIIGIVTLLPEPMTIALLGLGGILILRRRRR